MGMTTIISWSCVKNIFSEIQPGLVGFDCPSFFNEEAPALGQPVVAHFKSSARSLCSGRWRLISRSRLRVTIEEPHIGVVPKTSIAGLPGDFV